MTPAEIKQQMAFDWVAFVAEYDITSVAGPAQNLRNHLNSLLFSGLSIAKLKRLSAQKLKK
jgi:hypothetical protein